MNYIRLKTGLNIQDIEDRVQYNPEIIELHLTEHDLYEPEIITQRIQLLKSQGIRVYLHQPMTYKGQYLDIISSNQDMRDHYNWSCKALAAICNQEDIQCVIHCHYTASENTDYQNAMKRKETRKRIEEVLHICHTAFLWEDSVKGIFSAENPFLFSEIVEPLNLPLTIDVSHSFIALQGDNQGLERHLEKFHVFATYFHLADSMGIIHDALPLGTGRINWRMVKPYVNDKDFIFEVDLRSSNFTDCTPMVVSAEYFQWIE
ncbi:MULTISPECIES: TIM barrel protein [Bacillaceae]|uniref:TIM barrel protein n=1 Tax=Bacillaceae TaxID=186817 RepID=UPI00101C5DE0|nr:TIM barrel protein [Ectobacillus funiculus]